MQNAKHITLYTIATFLVIFLFDWFWHGIILSAYYEQTALVWRSIAGMEQHFYWVIITDILIALGIAKIFHLYCSECNAECRKCCFGLGLGLVLGGCCFAFYPYIPVPIELGLGWFVGGMIEGMLIASVLMFLGKKCQCK